MTTNHTPTRVALNDAYDAIVDVNAALTARVAELEQALRDVQITARSLTNDKNITTLTRLSECDVIASAALAKGQA